MKEAGGGWTVDGWRVVSFDKPNAFPSFCFIAGRKQEFTGDNFCSGFDFTLRHAIAAFKFCSVRKVFVVIFEWNITAYTRGICEL
nr:hypothetical protein Iba_chr14eCG5570 [Ipomoea batatas]